MLSIYHCLREHAGEACKERGGPMLTFERFFAFVEILSDATVERANWEESPFCNWLRRRFLL